MSTYEENALWLENIESELTTIRTSHSESLPLLVMDTERLARFREIAAALRSLAGEGPTYQQTYYRNLEAPR